MRVNGRLRFLRPRYLLILACGAIGLAAFLYLVNLIVPRTVAFAYAGKNCYLNPIVSPGLFRAEATPTYKLSHSPTLQIGSISLLSMRSCIEAIGLPKERSSESISIQVFGIIPINQIHVRAGDYPIVLPKTELTKPVSTSQSVQFELSQADQTFDYELRLDQQTATCNKEDQLIHCPIDDLELQQSAKYELTLSRVYPGASPDEVLSAAITTVEPMKVTASSIASGQVVYDSPANLSLSLNFPASHIDGLVITDGSGKDIPVTHSLEGDKLVIKFSQALPRDTTAKLAIKQISTHNGNQLDAPYSLAFHISGGPKVTGVNIGASKVSTNPRITIKFDVALASGQNLAQFASIDGVATKVSGSGNLITIQLISAMGKCGRFTVRVADGLKNVHGIGGGSAWSFGSRTICYDSFSIGSSVQGRAISAYRFGSGGNKLLFVGNTHGNEKSSTYLLNNWIDYLEANYDAIGNRTIIVVPNLNPDGYIANRRTNANNVDLNRNFPANDWKAAVTGPSYGFLPTGGGTEPLSEPESSAIARFILAQRPQLVLTYHAHAGLVMPNDVGSSVSLAHTYDSKSNVGYLANSGSSSVFKYDTTGAMEQWLHDKVGIATLLIELWTDYGNEFKNHQQAMWSMVQAF